MVVWFTDAMEKRIIKLDCYKNNNRLIMDV